MTKPFRVREEISNATRKFRKGGAGPQSLYRLFDEKGININKSALISFIPEQGACIVGTLIDQNMQYVSFDIDFDGSWSKDFSEWEILNINEFEIKSTEGDWWWKENPRQFKPSPNNHIYVAMELLKEETQQSH